MPSKRELEYDLMRANIKIELLEEQLLKHDTQVEKLQEALISVRAPEAYRDQKIAEEDANRKPIPDSVAEKNKITQEVTTEYMNMLEEPLFRSPDDMDDLITTGLIRNTDTTSSLHGNDES